MISIQPSSGSVTFVFDGNQYYLNNGSISYPLNSLAMVIDESDIVSFKNQAGDIVLGCHLDELGKTKAEMEELYESSFVGSTGGGGVTPEEVEEMIDDAVSGKADTSAVTQVNNALTAHTDNTTVHVTASDKSNWNAKVDRSELDAYTTTAQLNAAVSGKANTSDVNEALEVAARALYDVRDDASQALTQLGGNSIVALTQAQYDALQTKNEHTLYIITE